MKKNTILIGIGAASILVAYLLFKKKPVSADKKVVTTLPTPTPTPNEIIFTEPISRAYQDGFEFKDGIWMTPAGFYPEVSPIRPPEEAFVYPKVSPYLYQQSIEYGQSGLGDRLMINQLM